MALGERPGVARGARPSEMSPLSVPVLPASRLDSQVSALVRNELLARQQQGLLRHRFASLPLDFSSGYTLASRSSTRGSLMRGNPQE